MISWMIETNCFDWFASELDQLFPIISSILFRYDRMCCDDSVRRRTVYLGTGYVHLVAKEIVR